MSALQQAEDIVLQRCVVRAALAVLSDPDVTDEQVQAARVTLASAGGAR